MAEFMNRIPLNDEQKPALVFAFYNAVFFALLGLCLAGLFAVYQVLYMFLRPILWAMLVGTVLFPFKRKMSINFKGWLKNLDEDDRPLVNVYDTALSSTGAICAVLYVALKILTFDDVFLRLLSWIGVFCSAMDSVIGFFTMNWVVAFVLLYSLAFASYICLKDTKSIHKKFARHFRSLFGYLCWPIFPICLDQSESPYSLLLPPCYA
uniref:Uncharacterized protein n=1 Tax=Ditylenchus dipsaci TaxID=166011 RepID=A0A915DN53_9BILA